MPVPTTKIVNPKKPGEFLIINAADFDPAVHVAWTGAPAVVELPPAPAPVVNEIAAYDLPIAEAATKSAPRAKQRSR